MKKLLFSLIFTLVAISVFGQARVPLLVDPTNGLVVAPTNFLKNNTNLIIWQAEDVAPSGSDFILVLDVIEGVFKKAKLDNIPSALGVTNTATNLPVLGPIGGATQGIFSARAGTELQFRSLVSAGSLVFISNDANHIIISNPIAGAGNIDMGSNIGPTTLGPVAGVTGNRIDFNTYHTNQFASNATVISIKNGVLLTNVQLYGSELNLPTADVLLGGEFHHTNDLYNYATIYGTTISANNIKPSLASGPRVAVIDGAGNLSNSPVHLTNLYALMDLATNITVESRLSTLTNANTIYVRKDGNNATAIKGDLKRPYLTVSNAVLVAANGDTILIYPGEYNEGIDTNLATLVLSGKTNVSIIGVGNPKLYGTNVPYGNFIAITNCSDILISGITVIGATNDVVSATGYAANAINLGDTNKNIVIRDCSFISWARFGIIHKNWLGAWDANVVVVDNYFYDIGSRTLVDGAAIECGGGLGWLVSNNRIEKCLRGIELYTVTNGTPIYDITIQNNQILGCEGTGIIVINDNTNSSFIQRISINDNVVNGWITNALAADNNGIEFRSAQSVDISHNKLQNLVPPQAGLLISADKDDARDYNISGNTIKDLITNASYSVGLRVVAGASVAKPIDGVTIEGNRISGTPYSGMYIQGNNISVIGNSFQSIGYSELDIYPAMWVYLTESSGFNKATNILFAANMISDGWTNRTTDVGIRIDTNANKVTAYGNYFGAGITPYVSAPASNCFVYLGLPTNDVWTLPIAPYLSNTMDYLVGWSAASNRPVKFLANSVGGGSGTLAGLTDVSIPAPGDGEVLTYSGGIWLSLPAPGVGSGDDVTVNGGAIVNPGLTNKNDVLPANAYGIEWVKDGTNLVGYINFNSTHFKTLINENSNTITLSGELTNFAKTTTNFFALASVTNEFVKNAMTNEFVKNAMTNQFVKNAMTNEFVKNAMTNEFVKNALTNEFVKNALTNEFVKNAMTNEFVKNAMTNYFVKWSNGVAYSPYITNATIHATSLGVSGTGSGAVELKNAATNYSFTLLCWAALSNDVYMVAPTNNGSSGEVLIRDSGTNTYWGPIVVSGSQPASANLTNWSTLSTNVLWTTNAFQIGDTDLTNWASLGTNTLWTTNLFQIGDADLTNWATVGTNVLWTTNLFQIGSANLTNFATVNTNYFIPTNATLYHYVYIPAGSMLSTVLSNATAGTYTNANNIKRDTWDFDDSAGEYVTFATTLGDGWDLGTLKAKFHFLCAATNVSTTNIVWGIMAGQTTNTIKLLGSTMGTAVTNVIAGPILANELIVSAASPAFTVGGTLQKGFPLEFQVYRSATDAQDTQSGDARLLAVEIQYGVKFNLSTAW